VNRPRSPGWPQRNADENRRSSTPWPYAWQSSSALEERLRTAEIIIDVQKKVSLLLGVPLSAPKTEGND
jgi:hypothetical protein